MERYFHNRFVIIKMVLDLIITEKQEIFEKNHQFYIMA